MTGELHNILQSKPVLVVANHPYELEALALLATLPDRKDVHLIVNSHFYNIFSQADRYLIPAYIDHHSNNGPESWPFTLLGLLFSRQKQLSASAAHQKNIASIADAASRLGKGSQVIIFPERRGKDRSWYSGIGHLIHGVKNPERVFLARVYISGSSKYDLLRVVPFLRRFFPVVKVYFSPAAKLSACLKTDPKTTARELQHGYLRSFSTLVT